MKHLIQSFHGRNLANVPKEATSGLYILRSTTRLGFYRMGESSSIGSRLGTHGGNPLLGQWKKAPNFAETFRPWQPIWIATLGSADKLARVACEHQLFASFALRFPLIDDSAFESDPNDYNGLIELAETLLPNFASLLLVQTRAKFDKKAHWQMDQ